MINPDSDRFFKHGQFQYFLYQGKTICSSFIRFLFESLSRYFMIVIS